MNSDGKTGWIDFESEISIFIQALDAARKTLNEQFKKGEKRGHMEQWQLDIIIPLYNIEGKIPDEKFIDFFYTLLYNKFEKGRLACS